MTGRRRERTGLTRRRWCGVVLAGLAQSVLPWRFGGRAGWSAGAEAVHPGARDWLAVLRSTRSAGALGRACRASSGIEGTVDELVAALDRRAARLPVGGDGRPLGGRAEEEPPRDAPTPSRRLVRRMSQSDFEAGEVVSAEGWILSRTEARLCALAARSGEGI